MSRPYNSQPTILQVLPSLKSGGVERGTIEVARAIRAAGWQPIVASSGGAMTAQVNHAGAVHLELPLHSKNPLTIWRNAKRLEQIIRQYGVHIIHARSRAPAWSAYFAAKRTGCRFMTTFHGTYGLKGRFKQRYNSIMTRGERVIAISHFICDHIIKNYPVNTDNLRIIHRGVDLKLFHPVSHSPQRMIALAKEWRLPDEHPLILFPGRITRWKGQDVFIKALAALPHRNFFAIILGDDKGHSTYRSELEKLIIDSGLSGNVRIAGHTHYISEAYMLSKLIVATSIEPEAFGRVVLEAQAMGKPVIATNHGGPCETIIDGETGWLVPPGDDTALCSTINQALSMDVESEYWMGQNGMENARRFSMEMMCEATLSVYQELLS